MVRLLVLGCWLWFCRLLSGGLGFAVVYVCDFFVVYWLDVCLRLVIVRFALWVGLVDSFVCYLEDYYS